MTRLNRINSFLILMMTLFMTQNPWGNHGLAVAAGVEDAGNCADGVGDAANRDIDDLLESLAAGGATDAFSGATEAAIPSASQNIFDTRFKAEIMEFVLSEGGRRDNARFVDRVHTSDHTRYEIWTATGISENRFLRKKHVQSTVEVVLTTSVDENSLGNRTAYLRRTGPRRMEAIVAIHPNWLKPEVFDTERGRRLLRGLFRSAFVGDRAIHPHIVKDQRLVERKKPSAEQAEQLERSRNDLVVGSPDDLFNSDGLPARMPRVGINAPGGFGKTFMGSRFFTEHAHITLPDQSVKKFVPDVLVVCVHNVGILDGSIKSILNEFGWSNADVQRVHSGPSNIEGTTKGSKTALDRNKKLMLVTRSALHDRWGEFAAWFEGRKVGWFFDEAHYMISKLGESGGNSGDGGDGDDTTAADAEASSRDSFQFANIVHNLNSLPIDPNDPQHLMLIVSATLFRSDDAPIIKDPELLGYRSGPKKGRGKVSGPLLQLAPELADKLEKDEDVPVVSSYQLRQSMVEGYAAPIKVVAKMTATDAQGEETAIDRKETVDGKTSYLISESEIRALWEKIKNVRVRFQPDRSIIVVKGISKGDKVRDLLRQFAAEECDVTGEACDAEFNSLNSKSKNSGNLISWLRDEGDFAGGEHRHKYLIVDGMVNEGVDIPGLNLVVIHRTIRETVGGNRRVAQILMRGSRVAPFCTSTRVIDYSGRAEDVIDGISPQDKPKPQKRRTIGPVGPGPGTRVDDETFHIDEDEVPYVEEQTSLPTSIEARERILIELAPFKDVDVTGNANRRVAGSQSRLAQQLLRLAHVLPSVGPVGSMSFDNRAVQAIESEQGQEFAVLLGTEYFNRYNDLMQAAHELAKLRAKNPKGPKDQTEILDLESLIRMTWEDLRSHVMQVDPFREQMTTLKITGSRREDEHSVEIVNNLYMKVFAHLKTLGATKFKVSGPTGLHKGLQYTFSGSMAYGLLRSENGEHSTIVVNGKPYTRSIKVDVESVLEDESFFGVRPASEFRRVVDSRNSVVRDRASGIRAELKRSPTDTDPKLELTPKHLESVIRMMEWNYDNYSADLMEGMLIPELLPKGSDEEEK